MKLVAFSIEGYRRFIEKTSVKLHGDLIAFVGPNEAGKSSLLRAMSLLSSGAPFEANERPRRTKVEPLLEWHFQLEEDDRTAIDGIPGAGQIERTVVVKGKDGVRDWRFEPGKPLRDRQPRREAAELMRRHQGNEWLLAADQSDGSEFSVDQLLRVIEILDADIEDLDPGHLEDMKTLAQRLGAVPASPPSPSDGWDEETDEHLAESKRITSAWEGLRDSIIKALDHVRSLESESPPWRKVADILKPRLPEFRLFTEDDRNLASQYDLTETAASPPAALMHLASLAGLDLEALRDEAAARLVADAATRLIAANKRLTDAFAQSWNQQGIAVQIWVDGTILYIQASTPGDSGLSSISERSDGMRWFAALLAYAHGWEGRPILLVDEIEQHLHYDAQSDLVEVLAKQSFTSKVIYTTHSIGCLPHDLGTGVRVVHPIDTATSRIENGFWKQGSGFSPLLASMGAAAMSFTPTRHALIAEGAGDAILLPTLLRQASGQTRLGFQVAPGLSSVASAMVLDLEAEAGRVAFIVDGDEGGRDIVVKLTKAGIGSNRILTLTDPISSHGYEIEDLVDESVYAQAVNAEMRCWQDIRTEVTNDDLGSSMRTKALEAWCQQNDVQAPDKAAVAQRIVNLGTDQIVVAAAHVEFLTALLANVRTLLGIR